MPRSIRSRVVQRLLRIFRSSSCALAKTAAGSFFLYVGVELLNAQPCDRPADWTLLRMLATPCAFCACFRAQITRPSGEHGHDSRDGEQHVARGGRLHDRGDRAEHDPGADHRDGEARQHAAQVPASELSGQVRVHGGGLRPHPSC